MMDVKNRESTTVKSKRFVHWNWWKTGFFIALFAFEIARELAVLAASQEAQPSSTAHVIRVGNFATATGSWKRVDGGGRLQPTAVTIECREDTKECLEVWASMNDTHVFSPNIDRFEAKFSDDAISYENDMPTCARYSVRMDFKLEKVFAVRERKQGKVDPACTNLENRVEMTLADGFDPDRNPEKAHFVPVIDLLGFVARAF